MNISSFFSHMLHLKHNELGHSPIANAIVGLVDNVVDPVVGGVVDAASRGQVQINSTAPKGMSYTESQQSAALAAVLAELISVPNVFKAIVATSLGTTPSNTA